MTPPVPSQVRVVRIYSGAQMLSTRGITPVVPLQWPSKHPLDTDWWWVDATGWCKDVGDTLLAPPAYTITPNDGSLSVVTTAISADGYQAGLLLTGGVAGTDYTITIRLIGQATGVSWAGSIALPCASPVTIESPPSDTATMNGSVLTIGGVTIQPGQPA